MRLPSALKNLAWSTNLVFVLLHEQKHHEQISWYRGWFRHHNYGSNVLLMRNCLETDMDMKKIGAVVVAALLLLVILGRLNSNSSCNQGSTVAAAPADQPPADRWRVTESRSPMDDSKTVILALDSDDVVKGPVSSNRPTLIVRCGEGKTQVYVSTGMAASIEQYLDGDPSDRHTVRVRLDQNNAVTHGWSESTDHKALFASDIIYDQLGNISASSGGAAEFAKQLANASAFTFEFTPFDGSTQTARFDVRGLRDHLNRVAEVCAWHID
jgi:Type VI secretion system VasI, EvfG, VC_A0118